MSHMWRRRRPLSSPGATASCQAIRSLSKWIVGFLQGGCRLRPSLAWSILADLPSVAPCKAIATVLYPFEGTTTMSLPIPRNSQEILALQKTSVNNEVVASAIVGVIQVARDKGKSLSDLQAELLTEDALLSQDDRIWLSDLIASQWGKFWPCHRLAATVTFN